MKKLNFLTEQFNKLKGDRTNAVIFWNAIFYLIFITLLFTCPELAYVISAFLSLSLVVMSIDRSDFKDALWAPLAFVFWFGLVVVGFVYLGIFLYENTIDRFNKWLNNKYNGK